MTLAPFDFFSRFLQHVLPQGLHKIRRYGLLSPTHGHLLADIAQRLQIQHDIDPDTPTEASAASWKTISAPRTARRTAS